MWQYKDVNDKKITWYSEDEYKVLEDKVAQIKTEMNKSCYGLCGQCIECFDCKSKKVLDIIGE